MKGIYDLFTKNGQLIALGIGLICIIAVFASIFGGLANSGFDTSTDLNAILKDGGGDGFNFFNTAVSIPQILTIAAVAIILIFGVLGLVTNPKGSLIMLIALGVLVGLFFILTSMSEAETAGKIAALTDRYDIDDGTSKMLSGGIKTAVALAVLSLIGMVLMEIYNFFK